MILHIDMNSYFATVEQQANPRLRGKPIGVTGGPARYASASVAGGDRMPASPAKRGEKRTVLGAASIEAKKYGVKTGMQIWEAKKLCPQIILVQGDSDKYLECTKKFINILKDYSPYLEVFSIDECFLQLTIDNGQLKIAREIKSRIRKEIGEWITCSIGISYNKLMAKLAGSLQKPDGLVVIKNQKEAIKVLDKIPLDEICGIGSRIKYRLNKMGIFNFKQLRQVSLEILLFHFKSYGQFLYSAARGIDHSRIVPFYEREEVKSVGHRHTIDHDTNDPQEIKQILLKLCEMVAVRLRTKNLLGKTICCYYRISHPWGVMGSHRTIFYTDDGLEIFQAAWKIFLQIWSKQKIRMIGVSVSNLKPPGLTLLHDKKDLINKILDKVNQKFGDFTLQRGILLHSAYMKRKPNPYLSDRRFKL